MIHLPYRVAIAAAALSIAVVADAVPTLSDSFDTKTVGSTILGQSVEHSTFALSQWQKAGSANTTWTVDAIQSESHGNSLKASALNSGFSEAIPAFGIGEMPIDASYVASASIFPTSGGTLSPGFGLTTIVDDTIGFLTLNPNGSVVAFYGDGGTHFGAAQLHNGTAATFNFGAWNQIVLSVETTATSQTTTYFLNGQQLYLGGTPMTITRSAGSFAQLQGFKLTAQSLSGGNDSTGTAYFDNVSLAAPVPEPASFAALGLGLVAVLRRKRLNT